VGLGGVELVLQVSLLFAKLEDWKMVNVPPLNVPSIYLGPLAVDLITCPPRVVLDRTLFSSSRSSNRLSMAGILSSVNG
jgi:hypothetical protein